MADTARDDGAAPALSAKQAKKERRAAQVAQRTPGDEPSAAATSNAPSALTAEVGSQSAAAPEKPAKKKEPKVCPFFLKGNCRNGDACKLLHPAANGSTSTTAVAGVASSSGSSSGVAMAHAGASGSDASRGGSSKSTRAGGGSSGGKSPATTPAATTTAAAPVVNALRGPAPTVLPQLTSNFKDADAAHQASVLARISPHFHALVHSSASCPSDTNTVAAAALECSKAFVRAFARVDNKV
jgi:hypothetical protein